MSDFTWSYDGLVIDRPVLDKYLNDPSGAVGQYMKKRGKLVVMAAKRQVGVDTGRLRASIKMIHSRGGGGQFLKIGSNNKIALLHHEGSRPHQIRPRNARMLRFSAGGRMIYTHKVNHPGTRPNRYLSDNLRYVLA